MSAIFPRALMAALALSCATGAVAQFQLTQSTTFEEGKLPDDSVPFGTDATERVRVVEKASIPGMPPEFHQTPEGQLTGKRSLELESVRTPTTLTGFIVGIGAGTILERDRLGANGMTLYQADFFVPADGPIPKVAILATEPLLPPPANLPPMPRNYYRFGIRPGNGFYFSCVSSRNKEIAIHLTDPKLWEKLPRPGWHRLALSFEGPDTIRCFVDGHEAGFSPIKHDALRNVQLGIMLAEEKEHYKVYVDNLSIQLSGERIAIPDSPYAGKWKAAAAAPSAGSKAPSAAAPAAAAATAPGGGTISWLAPEAAWAETQRSGRPLLLYFHSPGSPATRELNALLASRPEAAAFLSRHSAAQVDVDRPEGSEIARKYNIRNFPSILIITPQATEGGRAAFTVGTTWEAFAAQLTR